MQDNSNLLIYRKLLGSYIFCKISSLALIVTLFADRENPLHEIRDLVEGGDDLRRSADEDRWSGLGCVDGEFEKSQSPRQDLETTAN